MHGCGIKAHRQWKFCILTTSCVLGTTPLDSFYSLEMSTGHDYIQLPTQFGYVKSNLSLSQLHDGCQVVCAHPLTGVSTYRILGVCSELGRSLHCSPQRGEGLKCPELGVIIFNKKSGYRKHIARQHSCSDAQKLTKKLLTKSLNNFF